MRRLFTYTLARREVGLAPTDREREFEQVIERITEKNRTHQLAGKWTSVAQKFSVVWIADASTLEAIKKHKGQLQEKTGKLLAGKILMVVGTL